MLDPGIKFSRGQFLTKIHTLSDIALFEFQLSLVKLKP